MFQLKLSDLPVLRVLGRIELLCRDSGCERREGLVLRMEEFGLVRDGVGRVRRLGLLATKIE